MRHYTVLYKYGLRARQFWRLFIQLGAMRLISYLTHACGIMQFSFIGLAIMIYETLYRALQIWYACASVLAPFYPTRRYASHLISDARLWNNCSLFCFAVNGGWSRWGAWGKCSKTCGVGYQQSKRYCNNPHPGYGGKKCTGSNIRTRACSVRSCAG